MTNENLANIAISNEPKTDLKRVIDLREFAFNREQEYLKIEWKVLFLDKEDERIEDMVSATAPYFVSTYASNSDLVDRFTGEYATEETDPETLIGEYDYFLNLAIEPIQIFEQLVSKASKTDIVGRFNK